MISSSQRPLPDNTQHSQQTDIHAPGGIRTHNLSGRAATDLHLRPRGNWDRQSKNNYRVKKAVILCFQDLKILSADASRPGLINFLQIPVFFFFALRIAAGSYIGSYCTNVLLLNVFMLEMQEWIISCRCRACPSARLSSPEFD